ncbi:MAG: ABC-2 family transporter protein [Candidatus Abawacabacteria bacterium]|nr:ABC-2 family transporter protein [Candidatus Abawacabacteria bacterium]
MKKFLTKLQLYYRLSVYMLKSALLSAMAYRSAFIMQIVSMIINDVFFIILWGLFFSQFPSVRGWDFQDNMVMLAAANISFGAIFFICGNWHFSKSISQGELDYYLTFPKSVLWQLLLSKTDISALGDIIFGIVVYALWGDLSLLGITKFMIVNLLSFGIVLNFLIITQSLAFYLGHFEEAAQQLLYLVFGFSLYPQNQFYGGLKVIMMTIVPAFFIISLPMKFLQTNDWSILAILTAFWLFTALLAKLVFSHGLKRYESGNLINVRL